MNYNLPNLPALKVLLPFIIGLLFHPLISKWTNEALIILVLLLALMLLTMASKPSLLKSVFILSTSFILGVFIATIYNPSQSRSKPSNSQLVSILKLSEKFLSEERLIIIAENIASGASLDSLYEQMGKVRITTDSTNWKAWNKGDLFLCNGKIYPSSSVSNPHAFNYGEYLVDNEIFYNAHIESKHLLPLSKNIHSSWLSKIRNYGLETLSKYIKDPIALDIAKAMILGMKKNMDKDIKNTFSDTGAIHVLAVSGLHVGIVGGMVYLIFAIPFLTKFKITRIIKPLCVIVAIWIFALVTGASASVIRSAVMFTILIIGISFRRYGNKLNILAAAAMGLLIYDPSFINNLSFQFSFLALLGILLFFPYLREVFQTPYKPINKITSLAAVSIAAQVMVAPLSIINFHQFPTYFILSSLLAVPAAFASLNLGILLFSTNLIVQLDSITQLIGTSLEKLLMLLYNCLVYLESLPMAVNAGLLISTLSATLLYAALISLFLFLQSRKATWIILCGLILIGQIIIHNCEVANSRKRTTLFVYNDFKGSYVELFRKGYSTWLYKDELSELSPEYINEKNRLYNHISDQSHFKSFGIEEKKGFFLIEEKLICLYPDSNSIKLSSDNPIDILTLSKHNHHLLKDISKEFKLKKVVLDGTLGNEKYKIRRKLNEDNIACHITSIDGPFILEL